MLAGLVSRLVSSSDFAAEILSRFVAHRNSDEDALISLLSSDNISVRILFSRQMIVVEILESVYK